MSSESGVTAIAIRPLQCCRHRIRLSRQFRLQNTTAFAFVLPCYRHQTTVRVLLSASGPTVLSPATAGPGSHRWLRLATARDLKAVCREKQQPPWGGETRDAEPARRHQSAARESHRADVKLLMGRAVMVVCASGILCTQSKTTRWRSRKNVSLLLETNHRHSRSKHSMQGHLGVPEYHWSFILLETWVIAVIAEDSPLPAPFTTPLRRRERRPCGCF